MATHFWSMLGVSRLLKSIHAVKHEANPDLLILGIIPTRFTPRTLHAREVVEKTKAEIGQDYMVYHAINESVRFADATGQGTTVFDIAPEIEGAQAYLKIAKEIVYGKS